MFCIFANIQIKSEPTPGIKAMLTTPASSFDVFLNQIYINCNGSTYFGPINKSANVRMTIIKYDYGTNLILMNFTLSGKHEKAQGMLTESLSAKKKVLIAATKTLAQDLGIEKRTEVDFRLGLLQFTKIRHGWTTDGFNEKAIINEIADHTVLTLIYREEEKYIYRVKRDQSGIYTFSMDLKKHK